MSGATRHFIELVQFSKIKSHDNAVLSLNGGLTSCRDALPVETLCSRIQLKADQPCPRHYLQSAPYLQTHSDFSDWLLPFFAPNVR